MSALGHLEAGPSPHTTHSARRPHPSTSTQGTDQGSQRSGQRQAGGQNEHQQQRDPWSDATECPCLAGPGHGHSCPQKCQREADKKTEAAT